MLSARNSQVLILLFVAMVVGVSAVNGQKQVDRTVAVVSDRFGASELITFSDVRWQLALEPTSRVENANDDEFERALETVINQRLYVIEANRLPLGTPTSAEIAAEIRDLVRQFPNIAEFERRLKLVGFESVGDDDFERLMVERIKIKRYIDFRFRSFAVVRADEEERYFTEMFLPDFKRRFPNAPEPSLDESRAAINRILVERQVAGNIESFLDEAKRNADIIILDDDRF